MVSKGGEASHSKKVLANLNGGCYKFKSNAEVVELVDTQDSGSCAGNRVLVRVQSSAP
jgi:hypothetical protein